jgi:hypothetical protein
MITTNTMKELCYFYLILQCYFLSVKIIILCYEEKSTDVGLGVSAID